MAGHEIKLEEIYDKNLNFLIGSGASSGIFPTLSVKMRNGEGNHTIETIATLIEHSTSPHKLRLKALLFAHYYLTCIKPIAEFGLDSLLGAEKEVVNNYEKFIKTILEVMNRKRTPDRRCNLFTTNYDGCLPLTADEILKQGNLDFVINDGCRGFRTRYLQAKNFNSYLRQIGVFSQHHTDLPQINLIHMHGSVYWSKEDENIVVDYQKAIKIDLPLGEELVTPFSTLLNIETSTFEELEEYANGLDDDFDKAASLFLKSYDSLPIVNPTKWKFHETVFEEHYYQMLRAMSYELEKPNTVFITFGCSFADEHILNLLKRSLSNPKLQLYVCCYTSSSVASMEMKFKGHNNVEFITAEEGDLDFSTFNNSTFTLNIP